MKKQLLSIAAIPLLTLLTSQASAQTWDGSPVSTTTSIAGGTALPMVGIGTNTPNHELQVEHTTDIANNTGLKPAVVIHDDIYTGTYEEDPIHDFYNIFEIKSTRTYDFFPPQTPNPMVQQRMDFFVSNNYYNTKVGINKSTANFNLDVGGDIHADYSVDAPVGNFTNYVNVENQVNVFNGRIVLSHPLDHDRNIEAFTSTGALNILSGNGGEDAGIRLFGRNHSSNPGQVQFISNGNTGSQVGYSFLNYDGSNWNGMLNIYKDGRIQAPNLSTGGIAKMVVADANGILSTQPITVGTDNQTLSVSSGNLVISGGNSVPLSQLGDDMGDHTATTDLNMQSHDIAACNKITLNEIQLPSCKISTTFQGASITHSGGAHLFIDGVPNSTSAKLYVYGDGYATGSWNTSDANYKKSIEDLTSVKQNLFKIQSHSYRFRQEEFKQWHFDSAIHFGFIAQEIEKVYPNLVRKENGYYFVNYTEFIPLLLQAIKEEDQQIQEQQVTIDQLNEKVSTLNSEKENVAALQSKLAAMEEQLNALKSATELVNAQQKTIGQLQEKVANLESDLNICCQANNTHTPDTKKGTLRSSLDQNVPNPFSGDTKIGFTIVEKYATAFIGIYDLNGRQIMQIPIAHDANHVMFTNEGLTPGMYVYSLVVDSQLIDSKKMIISE